LHPQQRHDQTAWSSQDRARAKTAGRPLHFTACLAEIRGDWSFLAETFHVPSWNKGTGICWRCHVLPSGYRDTSLEASWRTNRCDHNAFVARVTTAGHTMSCVFALPGVTSAILHIDWMHTVDLGVGQDVLGNTLVDLVADYDGSSRAERVDALWEDVQKLYIELSVVDRLPKFKWQTFAHGKNEAPKLRGKAAYTKGLVAVLKLLCDRRWRSGTVHQRTVCSLLSHLDACYRHVDDRDVAALAVSCRKTCTLVVALERDALRGDPRSPRWRAKPKLHLMQELCETGSSTTPKASWCYLDETFGGRMGDLLQRRGGRASPAQAALNVLLKAAASELDVLQ